MLMAGESSIRDVIAFPKTQSGSCPLTDAPSAVAAEQLRECVYAPSRGAPLAADGALCYPHVCSTLCVIWLKLEPTHIAWEACSPERRNTFQRRPPTCLGRFKRLSDTARWSTMNEGDYMMRRVYGMSLAALCIVLVSGLGVGCFWSSDEPTTVASETTVISSESSSTTEAGTTATSAAVTTTVPSNLVDGLPREYVELLGERPMVESVLRSGWS